MASIESNRRSVKHNSIIKSFIETIQYKDAEKRREQQNIRTLSIINIALAFVSLIMSYMNYIQRQYGMLTATIILTITFICSFIIGIIIKNKKFIDLSICIVPGMLFVYFMLSGGNDGFAILWTLLIPPFTMLLLTFTYGITVSAIFEIFHIVLFWTPLKSIVSAYYSQTFMLRFPVLYTSVFVLAFLVKYSIVKIEIAESRAHFANKAKSEFLSRVSHELRTPLNVVLSMAKLGLNDKNLKESTDRFAKIISSTNHLSDIINDVLEMSRMESGKTEIKQEPMHLRPVIEECLELIKEQVKINSVILVSSIDADLPETLIGDGFRIRQILINLLSNAVKFTQRGQVLLDVTLVELSMDKCMVAFAITDTGIGMSEDFLLKVFVPFEQEDTFLSRRYEGSGLGLSISYNLVELMGGKIEVESKLGEGSRFTCMIPFNTTKMEVKKEKTITLGIEHSLKGKRILLVDDVEINRIIVREVFANTGAELEEACDGEEAYQKFIQSPARYYDCIFMDIQMPKMDGYTTTGAIRASERSDSNIPIIAMTANALKEDIDSAIAAGMNDHAAKPIDFDDCISMAARWCNLNY